MKGLIHQHKTKRKLDTLVENRTTYNAEYAELNIYETHAIAEKVSLTFDFPVIGPLSEAESRVALINPAKAENVVFENDALQHILDQTRGYPYFLQEWGKHAWECADDSPITLTDCKEATLLVTAALDASFFRVRFDRLTPLEKKYLRAMAELGEGPHRSGDIAEQLNRGVRSLAPMRSKLIQKGMIWSPSHGDTAFTVPLFDQFIKRVMPTLSRFFEFRGRVT